MLTVCNYLPTQTLLFLFFTWRYFIYTIHRKYDLLVIPYFLAMRFLMTLEMTTTSSANIHPILSPNFRIVLAAIQNIYLNIFLLLSNGLQNKIPS